MDLNKAMIIGRLTRDPEGRKTPQGISVCNFSVATNLKWKDNTGNLQEKVEYHDIVTWRGLADTCLQYLKKGSRIYIEGRIQTRSWDDQQGQKRYRTEIIADNMIMLDSKNSSTGSNSSTPFPSPASVSIAPPPPPIAPPADDEIRVEDIPF